MNRWVIFFASFILISGCVTDTSLPDDKRIEASELNAELGLEYMRAGRDETALRKLEKSIEFNDKNGDAHHYIATLYRRLGKTALAETHFERAMDLQPDNTLLKNNYAVFQCDQGKFKEAEKKFNQVLNDPLYLAKDSTLENLAICELRQGNLRQAEAYFHQALKMNPKLPKSLLNMAQISFDKNQMKASYAYYERYREIAPQIPASLWLGILLEQSRDNKDTVASYSILLKNKFPNSEEARLLRDMEARNIR